MTGWWFVITVLPNIRLILPACFKQKTTGLRPDLGLSANEPLFVFCLSFLHVLSRNPVFRFRFKLKTYRCFFTLLKYCRRQDSVRGSSLNTNRNRKYNYPLDAGQNIKTLFLTCREATQVTLDKTSSCTLVGNT